RSCSRCSWPQSRRSSTARSGGSMFDIPAAEAAVESRPRRPTVPARDRGQWWRFVVLLLITAIVIVPIAVVMVLSLRPGVCSTSTSRLTLGNFANVLAKTLSLRWLANSVLVALATVVVSVVIAAPAGYVLSRGRGRLLSGYALLLFVIQSLPAITAVI